MRTDKLGATGGAQGASMSAGTQKHTKGPWRTGNPEWSVIKAAANMHVASVKWLSRGIQGKALRERMGAESLANARLIASAPELLEFAALVARMRTLDEFGDGDDAPEQDDWIETLGELIASARPLVAKATGATRETP